MCAHIIYKQTGEERKKQSETDTQAESKEEKYLTQINAVVGTESHILGTSRPDAVSSQTVRTEDGYSIQHDTQDSKTSGEQAKCLILLASCEDFL